MRAKATTGDVLSLLLWVDFHKNPLVSSVIAAEDQQKNNNNILIHLDTSWLIKEKIIENDESRQHPLSQFQRPKFPSEHGLLWTICMDLNVTLYKDPHALIRLTGNISHHFHQPSMFQPFPLPIHHLFGEYPWGPHVVHRPTTRYHKELSVKLRYDARSLNVPRNFLNTLFVFFWAT